ncbi:MAG: TVP38/TMEM64 family protein [Desulfomonilia bacterium]|jgi:uncharacterized membrane protein YdjX (TVP38/TMEM64 family)
MLVLFRIASPGIRLENIREWVHGLGFLGPLVFIAIYVAAVIAALPGAVITIAAGVIFGSFAGVVLVSIASTIGASLAFIIARYLARDFIVQKFSNHETFKKLDHMSRRHGVIIVAIARLIPIFPFNIINYGFGLTSVPISTYVFWSWLCMLPGTVLYVVGTDAVVSGISNGKAPWLLILIVLATAVLLLISARIARSRIRNDK